MDIKKKTPTNTITRDVKYLAEPTGNIYETVVLLSKRANQISLAEKKELAKKLEDFRTDRDTMDEVFENREQIEISKYYEKLPKPDLIAITEFEDGNLKSKHIKVSMELRQSNADGKYKRINAFNASEMNAMAIR